MTTEELYNAGKLPERYYNQLNGKKAEENYLKIRQQRAAKNKNFILSFVQNMLAATVKAALDEIFQEFKNRLK